MTVLNATFPLLTLMVAVPALGGLALGVIKPLRRQARPFGLAISLVVLVGAIIAACQFDYGKADAYQLAETHPWIPVIGTSWALGLNGLGLAMIGLSAILVPITLAAAWHEDDAAGENADNSRAGYIGLTLVAEAFMMLIFAARDVFLFYVAFEAMLVPMYFLVGRFGQGGAKAKAAALKFLLYSLLGGLIMLAGVIALYTKAPAHSNQYLLENLAGKLDTTPGMEMFIFVTFFIAFAIKAPVVPVHTWLADTTEVARPGTSTLLVGVLDKIGTFGMITLCLAIFADASHRAALPIIILAVISVLWGALAALAQKDLMRLISFTSVSHFGIMIMGIFVGSKLALTGAMVYMVAHGLSIAGLFLISGFLTQRGGTQKIDDYGGMRVVTPVLAGTWLVVGLAAIALPGLSGFVPELMVLVGTFGVANWAAMISILAVVAAALYILLPFQKIFTGDTNPDKKNLTDLDWREKLAVVTPLIVLMLVIGFFPHPLVSTVEPVSEQTVLAPLGDNPTTALTTDGRN